MDLLTAGVALAIGLAVLNLVVLLIRTPAERLDRALQAQTAVLETSLAAVQRTLEVGQRTEAEALRAALASAERALMARGEDARMDMQAKLAELAMALLREQGDQRLLLETKLHDMSEQAALRLSDIQRSVNERLTETIEKQMHASFQRVIDQFTQVQKAMTDVQAVTAQISDLKRVFTNVKTRGAWGEMQLRALLEDMLPHGAWEANRKLRADKDELVEFVLKMPSREQPAPLLAVDAKFPAEDYDRLLLASEAGDIEGERTARRALENRFRMEAKKIGSKYIVPPVTVDFAIMYLPTDGLYVEAARMPGLIETLNREDRVLVMGPSLLPALVRTLQLGALTLSIESRAAEISILLGAVRTEFVKMDKVLDTLERQAGAVSTTIGNARVRTRAMDRKLRDVTLLASDEAEAALGLEALLGDKPT